MIIFLEAAIERMGLDVNTLAASVATSGASNEKSAAMAAAQQVLQTQVEQVQQMTGVTLPSFYNPGAVNPMKYAQQIQKRKQLWANKVFSRIQNLNWNTLCSYSENELG